MVDSVLTQASKQKSFAAVQRLLGPPDSSVDCRNTSGYEAICQDQNAQMATYYLGPSQDGLHEHAMIAIVVGRDGHIENCTFQT